MNQGIRNQLDAKLKMMLDHLDQTKVKKNGTNN